MKIEFVEDEVITKIFDQFKDQDVDNANTLEKASENSQGDIHMILLTLVTNWVEQLNKQEMKKHIKGFIDLFWETFVELIQVKGAQAQRLLGSKLELIETLNNLLIETIQEPKLYRKVLTSLCLIIQYRQEMRLELPKWTFEVMIQNALSIKSLDDKEVQDQILLLLSSMMNPQIKLNFETFIQQYSQSLFLNKSLNKNFVKICTQLQQFLTKELKKSLLIDFMNLIQQETNQGLIQEVLQYTQVFIDNNVLDQQGFKELLNLFEQFLGQIYNQNFSKEILDSFLIPYDLLIEQSFKLNPQNFAPELIQSYQVYLDFLSQEFKQFKNITDSNSNKFFERFQELLEKTINKEFLKIFLVTLKEDSDVLNQLFQDFTFAQKGELDSLIGQLAITQDRKSTSTAMKGKFLLILLYILSDEYKGELKVTLKILETFFKKLKLLKFKSIEMQGFYESLFNRLQQIAQDKKDKKIQEVMGMVLELMDIGNFLEKFYYLKKYPQMRIYKQKVIDFVQKGLKDDLVKYEEDFWTKVQIDDRKNPLFDKEFLKFLDLISEMKISLNYRSLFEYLGPIFYKLTQKINQSVQDEDKETNNFIRLLQSLCKFSQCDNQDLGDSLPYLHFLLQIYLQNGSTQRVGDLINDQIINILALIINSQETDPQHYHFIQQYFVLFSILSKTCVGYLQQQNDKSESLLLKSIRLMVFMIPSDKASFLVEKNCLKIYNLILNQQNLNISLITKEIRIIQALVIRIEDMCINQNALQALKEVCQIMILNGNPKFMKSAFKLFATLTQRIPAEIQVQLFQLIKELVQRQQEIKTSNGLGQYLSDFVHQYLKENVQVFKENLQIQSIIYDSFVSIILLSLYSMNQKTKEKIKKIICTLFELSKLPGQKVDHTNPLINSLIASFASDNQLQLASSITAIKVIVQKQFNQLDQQTIQGFIELGFLLLPQKKNPIFMSLLKLLRVVFKKQSLEWLEQNWLKMLELCLDQDPHHFKQNRKLIGQALLIIGSRLGKDHIKQINSDVLTKLYKSATKNLKRQKTKSHRRQQQNEQNQDEQEIVKIDPKTGKIQINQKTEKRIAGYHREPTDNEDIHVQKVVEKNKLEQKLQINQTGLSYGQRVLK